MKKIISFVLAVIVLISVNGCAIFNDYIDPIYTNEDADGTEECLNEALCYICSDNGRSQYCIMGDNHQLIHGLCSDCQVDMFLHLAEHHTITEA